MPKKNKNSWRKSAKPNKSQSVVASKLTTLVELQRTQQHGSVPSIPDVARIHLKRNKVYTFQRAFPSSTVSAPTSGDLLAALSFTLSSLPNSTEFTSLFDQYRIVQVTCRFIPLAGAGTGSNPLITAIDYDDSTPPVAVTDLLQYDSYVMTQPGFVLERTLTPHVAVAAYSGAFTSFANAPNAMWIDVASPNVQYYGLKYAIAAAAGATANWSLLIEYVIQCKCTR